MAQPGTSAKTGCSQNTLTSKAMTLGEKAMTKNEFYDLVIPLYSAPATTCGTLRMPMFSVSNDRCNLDFALGILTQLPSSRHLPLSDICPLSDTCPLADTCPLSDAYVCLNAQASY